MQYDVAISFAGEQREEARQIAECLKKAGINVFFDEYEDAKLWGKNLYDHLSRVYQIDAKYCIILVSSDYARKVWTNHERQSAQARALKEKDGEYILPVRFDETDLPGLLPTISYLSFKDYGPGGVCAAFLRKTGKLQATRDFKNSALSVASSRRLLVFDTKGNTIAYIPVTKASWSARGVSFSLEPDDSTDGLFLDKLHTVTRGLVLAYSGRVAMCNVSEVVRESDGAKNFWELKAEIQEDDFGSNLEMGSSGTSKDQFAEMRARRLLLNEHPVEEGQKMNEVFREILLRGQGTFMEVRASHFPALFTVYGEEPQRFLEIAWIHAVMVLKLSNCVVDIEHLKLTLHHKSLLVQFRGRRRKEYVNAPAYEITIEGVCPL